MIDHIRGRGCGCELGGENDEAWHIPYMRPQSVNFYEQYMYSKALHQCQLDTPLLMEIAFCQNGPMKLHRTRRPRPEHPASARSLVNVCLTSWHVTPVTRSPVIVVFRVTKSKRVNVNHLHNAQLVSIWLYTSSSIWWIFLRFAWGL